MDDGISYRILLYYKSNGEFAKTALATAGTELEIPVVKGQEYLWYAYSHNTSENIPEPTSTQSPTIQTPKDKDLLYASGSVSTQEGENRLHITFEHPLTQVLIEVNSEGMDADIETLKTSLLNNDGFNQGTFNILTGATSNYVTYDADNTPFTFIDPTNKKVKTAIFYTANSADLTSIPFEIQALSIKQPNGTTRDLITPSAPVSLALGPYVPGPGVQLTARITITPEGYFVSGMEWAPGNL